MVTKRRPATGLATVRGAADLTGRGCDPRALTRCPMLPDPRGMAVVLMAVLFSSVVAPALVRAQDTGPTTDQPAEAPPLSSRYRFLERYSVEPAPNKPGALTQYRVGSR